MGRKVSISVCKVSHFLLHEFLHVNFIRIYMGFKKNTDFCIWFISEYMHIIPCAIQ